MDNNTLYLIMTGLYVAVFLLGAIAQPLAARAHQRVQEVIAFVAMITAVVGAFCALVSFYNL